MVQAMFQRPAWCHEPERTLDIPYDDLIERAYFDCYFARFPEWYFRSAMGVPATLWAEASPGRLLMLTAPMTRRLEQFQRLLEGYAWTIAGVTPEDGMARVHHFLLQALDRSAAGVEQLRAGDAYGALVRWHRASDFIAVIEDEPAAFRLRLLIDAQSYAECGRPEVWPPSLQ